MAEIMKQQNKMMNIIIHIQIGALGSSLLQAQLCWCEGNIVIPPTKTSTFIPAHSSNTLWQMFWPIVLLAAVCCLDCSLSESSHCITVSHCCPKHLTGLMSYHGCYLRSLETDAFVRMAAGDRGPKCTRTKTRATSWWLCTTGSSWLLCYPFSSSSYDLFLGSLTLPWKLQFFDWYQSFTHTFILNPENNGQRQ